MGEPTLKEQNAALRTENGQLCERFNDARSQIRSLETEVRNLKSEISDLKQRLHDTKMMHAEAIGYLKAMRDNQPQRMVPAAKLAEIYGILEARDARATEWHDEIPF